jgi:hypothetical protein
MNNRIARGWVSQVVTPRRTELHTTVSNPTVSYFQLS